MSDSLTPAARSPPPALFPKSVGLTFSSDGITEAASMEANFFSSPNSWEGHLSPPAGAFLLHDVHLCARISGSECTAVACLLELDAGTRRMPDGTFPIVLVLPGRERSPTNPFRYLAKGCPCGRWVDGSHKWIFVSLEKSYACELISLSYFFSLYLFCFSEWPRTRSSWLSQNSFTRLQTL